MDLRVPLPHQWEDSLILISTPRTLFLSLWISSFSRSSILLRNATPFDTNSSKTEEVRLLAICISMIAILTSLVEFLTWTEVDRCTIQNESIAKMFRANTAVDTTVTLDD